MPCPCTSCDGHWRRELRALGDAQVLLTLLAGAVGFGGMFAVYTYVVPTITEVGGLTLPARATSNAMPAEVRS